ncbi:MAG: hypothetical protein GPJ54_16990 [Candidatus Heimdallarchaeota archaeon]|nr:hypothetical protein [Candidatus Heimdallarchaeota archaeon]
MVTTVKVRDETKVRLDRLKAQQLLKGRKLNQEDLIDLLVTIAETHPTVLENELFKGVSTKVKKRVMRTTFDFPPSNSESIDEELYG